MELELTDFQTRIETLVLVVIIKTASATKSLQWIVKLVDCQASLTNDASQSAFRYFLVIGDDYTSVWVG